VTLFTIFLLFWNHGDFHLISNITREIVNIVVVLRYFWRQLQIHFSVLCKDQGKLASIGKLLAASFSRGGFIATRLVPILIRGTTGKLPCNPSTVTGLRYRGVSGGVRFRSGSLSYGYWKSYIGKGSLFYYVGKGWLFYVLKVWLFYIGKGWLFYQRKRLVILS